MPAGETHDLRVASDPALAGAVAFDQFSLCRTTNSDDELASVNTNDATIKGRKGDGRTEFVMSPVLRRSPKHRHA